ncbi:MAG: hypothetical protein HQL23_00265 [Candidatus Omnitrophica bacterium]|nr:hypothetical protein [Candidatus Omnitrophota bacterium]
MKNHLRLVRIKTAACLLLLLIFTTGVFRYTVSIRKPWFGGLSMEHHHWLTASTVKFTQYWLAEGPVKLKFGLIENPASIEFPTLRSRGPYPSYPPGTIIPLYLICKILRRPPTPALVMQYNLTNHFFIALLLSGLAFAFCRRMDINRLAALLFSLIPAGIVLLLPSPLFFFQNVFWSDQAIILPFVLLVGIEWFRDNQAGGKNIATAAASGFLLFYGALTDWFFIFLALALYGKRWLHGEYRGGLKKYILRSLAFWLPVLLAMGFFLWQLHALKMLPELKDHFLQRVGLNSVGKTEADHFFTRVWQGHCVDAFGLTGLLLLAASLILFGLGCAASRLDKKKRLPQEFNAALTLTGMLLLPGLAQIFFFRGHSAVHDFSVLKLTPALSVVPFVLIPVTAIYLLARGIPPGKIKQFGVGAVALLLFSAAGFYVKKEHPRFKTFFRTPNHFFAELGTFIAANTQEQDVVFSTKGAIGANPPLYIIYSKKRVYPVTKAGQIFYLTKDIPGNFTLNILSNGVPETDPGINAFIQLAGEKIIGPGGLILYKIKVRR